MIHLALLVLAGCSPEAPLPPMDTATSDTDGGGDWESDADTDTDTDADTDADSDTDTDTDADYDTDDGDTESDTGDGDTDTDTDTEACDDTSPVALYLSPDDSNSMSSPVQAREAVLGDWTSLRNVPIRTWEFLNYYGFAYTPPESGLGVTPLLVRGDTDGTFVLQIGVASPVVSAEEREALNVVLVLDTSGSMGGTPMELLKESARALVSNLREGDTVSMVEWSTTNAVHLEAYAVAEADDPVILAEIDALAAGGGTDLYAGLQAGYDIAARTYDPARINRVVLISDGGANAGITSTELIARHAGTGDDEGIYLVGVGVGTASTYDDTLMDTVTDVGRGASVFVATEDEAWRTLGPDGFLQVMDVAYRDVGVRLDLPPGFEIQRFSGEEYSTDVRDIEAQHIAPNDTMVFYQTLATCAPELATEDAELTVSVGYTDPLTFEQQFTTVTARFGDLMAEDTRLLDKGAAVYAYAEGLKACQTAATTSWPSLLQPAAARLRQAELTNPGDADLAEIRRVIEALGG